MLLVAVLLKHKINTTQIALIISDMKKAAKRRGC